MPFNSIILHLHCMLQQYFHEENNKNKNVYNTKLHYWHTSELLFYFINYKWTVFNCFHFWVPSYWTYLQSKMPLTPRYILIEIWIDWDHPIFYSFREPVVFIPTWGGSFQTLLFCVVQIESCSCIILVDFPALHFPNLCLNRASLRI